MREKVERSRHTVCFQRCVAQEGPKVRPLKRRVRSHLGRCTQLWRTWCALHILTLKCASRHNGVSLMSISTSKSALDMVWFTHFDLEMCFAPQRRIFFRHRNFEKCIYIYIYIQKESRPARFQTLKKKHMGMSPTEVSVFPLKVAILEPKTDTSS